LETLEEKDFMDFAASQNWPETDPDFITAKVNEFARSSPDKYNAIREDKNTAVKANVKKALDKNILTYDVMTGDVLTGDSVIMKVAKDNKTDYLGAIARWIGSAKNGSQVYDAILKQLES